MNNKTKALAHEMLDKMIAEIERVEGPQSLFDVSVQIQTIVDEETGAVCLVIMSAEITEDASGWPDVEEVTLLTKLYVGDELENEMRTDLAL